MLIVAFPPSTIVLSADSRTGGEGKLNRCTGLEGFSSPSVGGILALQGHAGASELDSQDVLAGDTSLNASLPLFKVGLLKDCLCNNAAFPISLWAYSDA